MTFIYTPHSNFNARVDLTRCRAAVHESGRGVGFYQCHKKPTVEREGVKYCTMHDPVREQAKREHATNVWEAKSRAGEARRTQREMEAALVECVLDNETKGLFRPTEVTEQARAILRQRDVVKQREAALETLTAEQST